LSSSNSDSEIIEISNNSFTQQSQSIHQFQQLDKSSEIACQQSIIKTQAQQKKQEWFHAEFLALFFCSKLSQNCQSQLILQIFAVNIYVFYNIIYDIDVHLYAVRTSIC